MTMRVLYAAQFDPAGVMAGHRAALRAAGVEAFLALNVDYRSAGVDRSCPAPDVLVVCPGIGTGGVEDAALRASAGVLTLPAEIEQILSMFPRVPRVAYFHGSVNAWANREAYARRYRERGFTLAASTLDYCTAMDATYLPPAITVEGPLAPLRDDLRLPLHVAHTPTNPHLCATKEFIALAIDLGVPVRYVTAVTPGEALNVKRACYATFDHLRGSFSVNSLEATTLGSIPLFGLSRPVRARMVDEGVAPPPVLIETLDDLRDVLLRLRGDVTLTAALQHEAREWAQQFTPAATAKRLVAFYESLS